MTIFYYDLDKYTIDEVAQIYNNVNTILSDDTVIAIPKEFSILRDCPITHLYWIKDIIERAIKEQENKDEN